MPDTAFVLDRRLADDTIAVGDLPLSRLLLIKDATYPWFLLVPRRAGAREIIDLDLVARGQLMTEIAMVSQALKDETGCEKLNVAALGNVVAQLHVHVIARFAADAAWPKPVWGQHKARAYDPAVAAALRDGMRRRLFMEQT